MNPAPQTNGNGYYATSGQLRAERHHINGESGNIRRRFVPDTSTAVTVQTLRKNVDDVEDDIR